MAPLQPAFACNTVGVAHLGSSGANLVVVHFQERRPSLEITDAAQIGALSDYFMDLGGGWRSTIVTASSLNGDLHFYRGETHIDAFWISPTSLGRGGCYRTLSADEFAELAKLLNIKEADLKK